MNTPPRPDQQIDPPPAVLHPGGAAGTFRGRLVVIFGSSTNGSTGLFVYSPTPAAGNLIASISSAGGTDPYGNAYLIGVASYNKSTFTAASLTGGQLNIWTATSEAGPWTQIGQLAASSSDMVLQSNRDIVADQPVGLLDQAAPTAVSGRVRLFSSSGGQMQYVADSANDGNTYSTGTLRKWLTTTQGPINSTTPTAITSLSTIPVAAQSYLVRGMIVITQGSTTATQAVRITGPTTSLMNIAFTAAEGTSVTASGVVTATGTNFSTGAVPGGTTGELHFDGVITFSAAGNFGMQALCVTSNLDTWTVGTGSYVEICPT